MRSCLLIFCYIERLQEADEKIDDCTLFVFPLIYIQTI